MDQPPSMPSPPAPPAPTTSLVARMLNIFAVPGEVFEEVKAARPTPGNWLVPVLLYGLVAAVSAVLIMSQPVIRQQMREGQEKRIEKMVEAGTLTREQADRELGRAQDSVLISTFSAIGAFAFTFVSVCWWAFLLWLIGRILLRIPVPFSKTLEVAGLSSTISALEGVVHLLLVVSFSNPLASPSLALLLKNPDPQGKLFMLLNLVNLMTFWVLIVRSIGLARLTGVRFSKAAGWVFIAWALMMMALMGLGLLAKSAFGQ